MTLATELAARDEGRLGGRGPDGKRATLGVQLIAAGLVTGEQVELGLEEQRRTGRRLGEILVANDVLFEDDLARTLAEIWGMPYRDLSLDPSDPRVLDFLPEAFCRRRGVLPLDIDNGALMVAVSDPLDLQTFDDLHTLLTVPFIPMVAARTELRKAIESGYSSRLLDEVHSSEDEETGPADGEDLSDADGSGPDSLDPNQGPVIEFVNQLLVRAVGERASDVHVEPTKDGLRIRFRVDGLLHDAMTAPASFRLGVVSRIKVMTDMDISNHRRPQDGRMSLTIRGEAVDIRAASIPTINGEALVLRILRTEIQISSTSTCWASAPSRCGCSRTPSGRRGAWYWSRGRQARASPPRCTRRSTSSMSRAGTPSRSRTRSSTGSTESSRPR